MGKCLKKNYPTCVCSKCSARHGDHFEVRMWGTHRPPPPGKPRRLTPWVWINEGGGGPPHPPHDQVTRKHRCVAERGQRKRACQCDGGSQSGTQQTLRPKLSPKATMP